MKTNEYTKIIAEIENININKQIKKLLNELKNIDIYNAFSELLIENESLNKCIEIYERKNYDFIDLLNPILCSNISIDEYRKVLIYLYSLVAVKFKTKDEVLNNKEFPKINNLLNFLSNLESNKELFTINTYFSEKENGS